MYLPDLLKSLKDIDAKFPNAIAGAAIPGDESGAVSPHVLVVLAERNGGIYVSILGVHPEDKESTIEGLKKLGVTPNIVKPTRGHNIN